MAAVPGRSDEAPFRVSSRHMSARSVGTVLARLAGVGGAQSVPIGGVLAADWTPATGLALFWFETLLLALVAVGLAALVHRDARRQAARGHADPDRARATAARLEEVRAAHIVPRDVFAFHVGSLLVFALFFSGVVFMLSQKPGGERISIDLDALQLGAAAVFGFVALGAASDILGFRRLPAGEVGARVDACTGRWAMFWLLGFAGPILVAVFGKPMAFFAFFGLLKAWWEIARVFTKGGVRRPTATYP